MAAEPESLILPPGLTPIGRDLIRRAVAQAEHQAKLYRAALARGVQGGGPTSYVILPRHEMRPRD